MFYSPGSLEQDPGLLFAGLAPLKFNDGEQAGFLHQSAKQEFFATANFNLIHKNIVSLHIISNLFGPVLSKKK